MSSSDLDMAHQSRVVETNRTKLNEPSYSKGLGKLVSQRSETGSVLIIQEPLGYRPTACPIQGALVFSPWFYRLCLACFGLSLLRR